MKPRFVINSKKRVEYTKNQEIEGLDVTYLIHEELEKDKFQKYFRGLFRKLIVNGNKDIEIVIVNVEEYIDSKYHKFFMESLMEYFKKELKIFKDIYNFKLNNTTIENNNQNLFTVESSINNTLTYFSIRINEEILNRRKPPKTKLLRQKIADSSFLFVTINEFNLEIIQKIIRDLDNFKDPEDKTHEYKIMLPWENLINSEISGSFVKTNNLTPTLDKQKYFATKNKTNSTDKNLEDEEDDLTYQTLKKNEKEDSSQYIANYTPSKKNLIFEMNMKSVSKRSQVADLRRIKSSIEFNKQIQIGKKNFESDLKTISISKETPKIKILATGSITKKLKKKQLHLLKEKFMINSSCFKSMDTTKGNNIPEIAGLSFNNISYRKKTNIVYKKTRNSIAPPLSSNNRITNPKEGKYQAKLLFQKMKKKKVKTSKTNEPKKTFKNYLKKEKDGIIFEITSKKAMSNSPNKQKCFRSLKKTIKNKADCKNYITLLSLIKMHSKPKVKNYKNQKVILITPKTLSTNLNLTLKEENTLLEWKLEKVRLTVKILLTRFKTWKKA